MLAYLRDYSRIMYTDWDMDTVTAGDYTLEYQIPEETFETYKRHHLDEEQSVVYGFYNKMQNDFEKIFEKKRESENESCQIEISFAFSNSAFINKLKLRGMAMRYGKFQEAKKYEDDIQNVITNDKEKLEAM